jgi:glycogen debranching enzyme
MELDRSKVPEPVLESHPEWVDLYYKAWEICADHVRTLSDGRSYLDVAWMDKNYQWVWDSCFISLYARYAPQQFPGMGMLDMFYSLQRDDGYISMTYDFDIFAEPWPNRINPPLFAWVEWEYYLSTGDSSRLARVVGHIEKLMQWIDDNRRTVSHKAAANDHLVGDDKDHTVGDDRFYYYRDTGSSGLDDAPRVPRITEVGKYYDWIDLSAQMVLSFRMLSRINRAIDNSDRAEHWHGRAEELATAINKYLWSDNTRFYHDRMVSFNLSATKTIASFWPILAQIPSKDQLDSLVEHLLDEREFNRHTPVPSLSADDPNYNPRGGYIASGTWAPTNYMITRGLVNQGRGDVAHMIAMKYIGVMSRTYTNFEPHTIWEAYCNEEDRPCGVPYTHELSRTDFVGWSGLGPIAMLIENVIGLNVNAPKRQIEWEIRLLEEHGVRNLSLGELGSVSMLCKSRTSVEQSPKVVIRADSDITVKIRSSNVVRQIEVKANVETGGE